MDENCILLIQKAILKPKKRIRQPSHQVQKLKVQRQQKNQKLKIIKQPLPLLKIQQL